MSSRSPRGNRRSEAAPGEPLPAALVALLGRAGFSPEATPRLAPAMDLRDLDGNATSLADHDKRLVLVLFWGTTCSHCLAELPSVLRFVARQRQQGLAGCLARLRR